MALPRLTLLAVIAAAFSLTLAAAMAGAVILCAGADCGAVQAVLRPTTAQPAPPPAESLDGH